MKEFVKCDYIFDRLKSNLRGVKTKQKPGRDADGVFTAGIYSHPVEEDKHIDICYWYDGECELGFWDLEMKKSDFPSDDPEQFLAYIQEKGVILNNVEDRFGNRWVYAGIIPKEDVFRIQFYEYEEDYLNCS